MDLTKYFIDRSGEVAYITSSITVFGDNNPIIIMWCLWKCLYKRNIWLDLTETQLALYLLAYLFMSFEQNKKNKKEKRLWLLTSNEVKIYDAYKWARPQFASKTRNLRYTTNK